MGTDSNREGLSGELFARCQSLADVITAIVLLSAFLHAAWNAKLKAQEDTTTAGVIVLALAGSWAGVLALFLPGVAFPQQEGLWWTLLSGVLETSYFLSLIWCLQRAPLSQVYGFSRGGALLVVWPVSVMFFAEPLRTTNIVGGWLVLSGLLLTAFGSETKGATKAILLPLVACAASIGGYHLLYKKAMLCGAQPVAVFAVSILVAAPANLFWHRKALRARWASLPWGALAWASILCTMSFVLTLVALGQAGAGWVLTLRNTSVIFALLFSWRMGEVVQAARIYGTALIAVGAFLLGLE